MLNLLPPERKALLQQEYNLRFAIVLLGTVAAALAVFVIALIPSYAFISLKASNSSSAPQDAAAQEQYAQARARASSIERTIALVGNEGSLVSQRLDKVLASREGISLLEMSFVQIGEPSVMLRGVAADRQALVAYVEQLRAVEGFESVDVPISTFVRTSDISFSITIKVSEQ